MRVGAIVVAGGRGERFGGLKQFAMFDGRSLAAIGVQRARCVAQRVVLVVPEGYDGTGEGADDVVSGGATRSDSVRCGLALIGEVDVVIIHDAARPLATEELFRAVLNAVDDGASAAIPGLAITDTVKKVDSTDRVTVLSTIARDDLVTVQTPQAFRLSDLLEAHQSEIDATDDAFLVELLGRRVVIVPGERTNIKVTESHDMAELRTLSEMMT